MSDRSTKLLSWTLPLIMAGTCLAQAGTVSTYYVDDRLDWVDTELEERSESAPDVEVLAPGLDPVFVDPTFPEPDDLRALETPDAKGFAKGVTGPMVGSNYIW